MRISSKLSYCTGLDIALVQRLAFISFAILVDGYICKLGKSVVMVWVVGRIMYDHSCTFCLPTGEMLGS